MRLLLLFVLYIPPSCGMTDHFFIKNHKIKNGVKVNANTSTSSESQAQESNSQNEVIKPPAEVTATEVQA